MISMEEMRSPVNGIVTSSRVRLARNVEGHSFPGWLKKTERQDLLKIIKEPLEKLKELSPSHINESMDNFNSLEKQRLVEQHLISREHAAKNAGSALVVSENLTLSIMVNEEDHLRLQSIRHGYQLKDAWAAIDHIDSELEKQLDFSYSTTLGYLTACPTNVGTGMRASAMLHLPALVLSEQINQVIKAVNQIGLAVRGLYGEGTEALGNLFQISNQMTLGESEQQILDRLIKVIDQIVENEQNARLKLLQEKGRTVADQIGRSYGALIHAYSITSKEALNHLSLLKLAVDLDLLPSKTNEVVDELFITTQPAHLQISADKRLNAEERDAFRADILREKLSQIPSPSMNKLQV